MQSKLVFRVGERKDEVTYEIPRKVRLDGWWLLLPARPVGGQAGEAGR